MAIAQVITQAGLNAYAMATTTVPLQVASVELGQARGYTPTDTQAALMTPFSPIRQLPITGSFVSANKIILNFEDTTNADYEVGEVLVKNSSGTVLWVITEDSNSQWLYEKTDRARTRFVLGISVQGISSATVTFPAPAATPLASETTAGLVEFATQAEAQAQDTTKGVTAARVIDAVPAASETVAGKVEFATEAEAQARDTSKGVTAERVVDAVPSATTTVSGKSRRATTAEITSGSEDTAHITSAGLQARLNERINAIKARGPLWLTLTNIGIFGSGRRTYTPVRSSDIPAGLSTFPGDGVRVDIIDTYNFNTTENIAGYWIEAWAGSPRVRVATPHVVFTFQGVALNPLNGTLLMPNGNRLGLQLIEGRLRWNNASGENSPLAIPTDYELRIYPYGIFTN